MTTAHHRILTGALLASILVLAVQQLTERSHRERIQLGVSPGVVSMVTEAGSLVTKSIVVTNRGVVPARIINVDLLTDADDLEAAENCTTAPLAPGDSCDIQLEYAPSEPAEQMTSKIRLTVAGGASKDLTVTVEARKGSDEVPQSENGIWI